MINCRKCGVECEKRYRQRICQECYRAEGRATWRKFVDAARSAPYDCPLCHKTGRRAGVYQRCTDCHGKMRRKSYLEKWGEHAREHEREKYRTNPDRRAALIQAGRNKAMASALARHEREMSNPRSSVYFIQEVDRGFIKIGFTTKPVGGNQRSRMYELQVGNPSELRVLASFHGSSADELALHYRFHHLYIRGEWYRPGPDLLAFIGEINARESAAAA